MTVAEGVMEGGTLSTKRASRLRRRAPEGLECHAEEFGPGLRVRLAMTWSELRLEKITAADDVQNGSWEGSLAGGQTTQGDSRPRPGRRREGPRLCGNSGSRKEMTVNLRCSAGYPDGVWLNLVL